MAANMSMRKMTFPFVIGYTLEHSYGFINNGWTQMAAFIGVVADRGQISLEKIANLYRTKSTMCC